LVVAGVMVASRGRWQPWAGAMFGQLQRCALSVQLNVAEGYALSGGGFRRHLAIAYGSAVETGDLLELMRDLDVLGTDEVSELVRQNRRCQGLVLGLLRRERRRAGTP
jgi:four helix bundle protein